MTTSLFGHLAGRFATHPENLATEALAYILRNSPTARAAFRAHLAEFAPGLPADLVFRTQATDADNAIPDLAGADESGQTVVIVEAKFWAGLTDNQPGTYLKRLPGGRPGLLLFIAPEARLQALWPELLRRCPATLMSSQPAAPATQAFRLQTDPHHSLALTSWRAVLGTIDARLAATGEDAVRADVHQLTGLCERMDSDAFIPLKSDEFAPLIGRRIDQYCAIIEDVVGRLVEAGVGASSTSSHMPGRPTETHRSGCGSKTTNGRPRQDSEPLCSLLNMQLRLESSSTTMDNSLFRFLCPQVSSVTLSCRTSRVRFVMSPPYFQTIQRSRRRNMRPSRRAPANFTIDPTAASRCSAAAGHRAR